MGNKEDITIWFLVFTIMGFLLVIAMIFLFFVFYKRKANLLKQQETERLRFEKELAESQIEIREETLRHISWELHDNIGQLMTLAKIQAQNAQNKPEKIEEVAEIIGNALGEIRSLSRSINPENLKSRSLVDALEIEIERLNRLNFIDSELHLNGNVFEIPTKDEVILFRILQEFFSNTIRHSRATTLNLNINFTNDSLEITAIDNGIGFEPNQNFDGIGLKNMIKRAELIDSKIQLKSIANQGTTLTITYPKTQLL